MTAPVTVVVVIVVLKSALSHTSALILSYRCLSTASLDRPGTKLYLYFLLSESLALHGLMESTPVQPVNAKRSLVYTILPEFNDIAAP